MNEPVILRVGDPARLAARRQAWERFHRWEGGGVSDRPVGEVIADLGTLRELLPDAAPRHDPDPAKLGIARMYRDLAGLGRAR